MFSKDGRKRQCHLLGSICKLTAFGLLLLSAGTGWTASKPTTVAEIALYQGADREQVLTEGAKREGQMMFYNSNTWLDTVVQEFEKKFPFVKVSIWRSDSTDVVKRSVEEFVSGRFLADVIEITEPGMVVLRRKGIYQEYYSPEMAAYENEVQEKGKTGVFYLADRELYIGLGFNTKLVSPVDAPKNYKDLLDPKWKGKMALAGSSTGIRWLGNVLDVMGREFLEKMSQQEVKVHNISGAALVNHIASGEVRLSPTIFYSNIFTLFSLGFH